VPVPRISSALCAAGLIGLAWIVVADEGEGGRQTFREEEELEQWGAVSALVEATIGALEVGTLAYFSDRKVIDLLGLVSPEALANVAKRQVIETLRASPTDWFVLTSGLEALVGPVRSLPWFAEGYELARELPGDGGQVVWVFRKRR
jgi:hypothetical protein